MWIKSSGLIEELLRKICGESRFPLGDETPIRSHWMPDIVFKWTDELGHKGSTELDSFEAMTVAKKQFLAGLKYLQTYSLTGSRSELWLFTQGRIVEACLGAVSEERLLVTASSPQEFGRVWFAGQWPSLATRRIAASIVHEAVHQELYRRESAGDVPWRHNSIAYSPWKRRERPGRWVWHAFWTFSVHCAFLADSIDADVRSLSEDAMEVAGMYLRLRQCLESILLFNVLEDQDELHRVNFVANLIFSRISSGTNSRLWITHIEQARPYIEQDFAAWAKRIISTDPTLASGT